MKRAAEDRDRTRREWRRHYQRHLDSARMLNAARPVVTCICDRQPGIFRKHKAGDCGRARCQICHSHKYPGRKPTVGERRQFEAERADRRAQESYVMTDHTNLADRRAKLTLAPADVNAELVQHLEAMLAEARRGELLGLWCVRIWRGAYYDWRLYGHTFNAERTIGELELLREDVIRRCYDDH